MAEPNFFLTDIWYFAMPGSALAKGAMQAITLLGQPVLLGRATDGGVFALRDICPHRGIPLSCGRFDGKEVECCYHGWRFDRQGKCTDIPSLVEGQDFDLNRIRVRDYPVREISGNIWIWMGTDEPDQDPPQPPGLPADKQPDMLMTMDFPCHLDHAVVGLMDPAHGPFVHQSWFWRTPKSIHAKQKAFGPAPFGFVMKKHRPSSNSRAYAILGGVPETEISFRLPGVRTETIEAGKNRVWNLTAVTPLDENNTRITNMFYWTMPWASLLKPVFRPIAQRFLGQDRDAVVMQQQGLRHNPTLMLIKDADTQARWYYQLKNEFRRAREEKRPFENPVRDTVLRWRS
ncbi:aromatic ring-hydroxylating oxygenase subunit alpha [Nitrospirillum pindoramense]|uniref:Phenylpropionate dioxygenase-like ring-hydroxylating dioxygenase large terminal subunit n=1 Tax=Nitrospirillum amazonense TaxID=28077 RepID=A0A560GP08_9PROT|nr:aromatic ring-hydroxylating dioxygenase subunit alpha [Nitrospirillum amazonense]TWB35250.1 phenylpropionate dioxygenase-like ring-hydroxylating dioxygenase large terminal subunit [Nitrospirillum amazonense]